MAAEPNKAPESTSQVREPDGKDGTDKAKDGTQADGKPAAAEPGKPGSNATKAKTLREVYDATKAELAKVRTEFDEFKKTAGQPKEDPEKAQLTEKLTAAEKRLTQLQDTLKFKDFTLTDEYDREYKQPYMQAFNEGRGTVAKLKITSEETGETRQGAPEDFDRIMSIADPDQAAEAIEALFGKGVKAQMVAQARAKALDILNRANEAEERYKKDGGEQDKRRQEQAKTLFQKISAMAKDQWTKAVAAPFNDPKLKPIYTPTEGDAKEAELFEAGKKFSEKAFSQLNAHDPRLTPEQRQQIIEGHAEIFNKAAAFDMLLWRLATHKKKLAAAEKKLKEYEDSEPKPGADGRGKKGPDAGAPLKGWEAARASLNSRIK